MFSKIKIKHDTSDKKCNKSCNLYKIIQTELFITNFVCSQCKHRNSSAIRKLLKKNKQILNIKKKMI